MTSIYEAARESAEQTHNQIKDSMKEEQETDLDTIGLMYRILVNLGYHPQKDDDGTIRVAYQGKQFLDNYLASSQASSMPSRTAHSVYRYSNNLDFLSVNFNIVKEFPGFAYNVVYGVFINVKS